MNADDARRILHKRARELVRCRGRLSWSGRGDARRRRQGRVLEGSHDSKGCECCIIDRVENDNGISGIRFLWSEISRAGAVAGPSVE